MVKKTFKISGMHCNSCRDKIERTLSGKVEYIKIDFAKEIAEIIYHPEKISEREILDMIKEEGYELTPINDSKEIKDQETKDHSSSEDIPQKNTINISPYANEHSDKKETKNINLLKITSENIGWIIAIGSIILLLTVFYFFMEGLDINVQIPSIGENTSLFLLFLVGVLTGFHCIAMCGGFVVAYTSKNAMKGHKSFTQHFVYGGSKLLSYALIGGFFGLIGGIFAFSVGLRGFIAVLAGVFMIFYALSMMGLKFFRRFQFNPKFLTKAAYKASAGAKGPFKAPFITGLLSGFFIACGPLQAMYLYAMGTGNFLAGTSSLAAFGLGTLPVMIGFGSMTTVISHKLTKKILKVSAVIVLILGIIMLNRGLTVLGSPITYDSLKESVFAPDAGGSVMQGDYQVINMEVNSYGWKPDSFVLKKGVPVKWNIDVKELTGCNNEIIVRDYGLDIKLKEGMNVVEFTPDKEGTIRWSCWMGMIPGSFIVTDSGEADEQMIAAADPGPGGSCGAASGGSCGCGG